MSAVERRGLILRRGAEAIKTERRKFREIEGTDRGARRQTTGRSDERRGTQRRFPTSFRGKDLDGNDVDNSLFANNAFTVVNFWFNGCKPCVPRSWMT